MEYHIVFKKTLQELITEIQGILAETRYDVPDLIKSDLKAASFIIASATPDIVVEIMQTFGKFVIPYEKEINQKNVEFFDRLEICKHCVESKKSGCVCKNQCKEKCACDAKCSNCSELLTSLDSKTFTAIKYIINQAIEDTDEEKQEDIDVIFNYISSLLAAAKNHKKR